MKPSTYYSSWNGGGGVLNFGTECGILRVKFKKIMISNPVLLSALGEPQTKNVIIALSRHSPKVMPPRKRSFALLLKLLLECNQPKILKLPYQSNEHLDEFFQSTKIY